jgi:O-antigen ligase
MNVKIAYLDKLWYFLVYTLALFPILPRGAESIIVIGLFFISLIQFLIQKDKESATKREVVTVIIFSTIFFLYVIGLIYSQNLKEGLKYIVRVLPIISFPIIFGLLGKNKLVKINQNYIFNLYILSLILGLIFIQTYLFLNVDINIISNWEYRNAFEDLTGVHGTYYSLWLSFGSLILLTNAIKLFSKKKYLFSILFIILLCYFIYWQIVIGARLPLIITITLLAALLIEKVKSKKIIIAGAMLLFIFISTVIIIKPNYLNRFQELIKYDFSLPDGDYRIKQGEITNEQIRNGIYYCSIELAKKKWLTGYGIGDVNQKLQYCYKAKIDSNVYQIFNFNTHNQYLHFLLSSGVIGLLLFLISLLFPLYLAYRSSNYLYILFSLLIIITLLTENVLNRHDGIIFYSFFNSIFAFLSRNKIRQ